MSSSKRLSYTDTDKHISIKADTDTLIWKFPKKKNQYVDTFQNFFKQINKEQCIPKFTTIKNRSST